MSEKTQMQDMTTTEAHRDVLVTQGPMTYCDGCKRLHTPQPTDAARAEAHAAFGLAMLRYFYEDEFFFETEQSEDICPILAAHGFMEWRAYDPATDGEHSILYAGDEGWFWTATAIAAARKE
jgi:hypothetical protein